MDKPKTKVRPLTTKESTFVKAKVAGKSNTEAAMLATGAKTKDVAKTQGHRLSTNVNVQEAIQAEMHKQGITIEQIVRPVTKALNAKKIVQTGSEFSEVDDIPTQLKGVQFATQFMGFKAAEANPVSVHFHQHTTEKQAEYSD